MSCFLCFSYTTENMKFVKVSSYTLAVILMLCYFAVHVVHSAVIKMVGMGGVFSTYELIFVRSIFAVCVLLPFFITKKISFIETKDLPLNLITAGLSILASYCWHYGLSTVEINNATTISFLEPVVISVLAVFFLKEKISQTLIFSLVVCFITIVCLYSPKIIVQRGYLFLFSDVLFYSFSMILAQKLMIKKQSPATILFFKAGIVCLTSLHATPELVRKISQNYEVLIPMLVFSVLYVAEMLLVFTAYKLASLARLQPLIYTKFIFAAVLSYALLGEILTLQQFIAAAIVISVNINLFLFERKRQKSKQ